MSEQRQLSSKLLITISKHVVTAFEILHLKTKKTTSLQGCFFII